MFLNAKQIEEAIKNGELDKFVETLERDIETRVNELENEMQEAINAGYGQEITDMAFLREHNLRLLDKEDEHYFKNAVEMFEQQEITFPVKSFNRVFEDLRKEHPILSRIDFQNTTGVTEWLKRTKDVEPAWWGKICEEVKKKLTQGFEIIQLTQNKLSVSIFMCRAMLKLSPQWLERLIREMLAEAIAMGIEMAVVAGTGVDQPIGIMKDTTKPFDPSTGYADKEAVVIKDFSAKTLGKLMGDISKGEVGFGADGLSLVVNPQDYWYNIFPELVYRQPDGTYIYDRLPIPVNFVQSKYIPVGKAVLGNLKDYFFGVASPLYIEDSIHYQFVERNKIYIGEMLANGKPIDNDSFMVLDISAIGKDTTGTGA